MRYYTGYYIGLLGFKCRHLILILMDARVTRRPKLRVAREDEIPELLSGVSHYLDEKAKEIVDALEDVQTWEPYLRGYRTGILVAFRMASEIVEVMADRATSTGKPWLPEPYLLEGRGDVLRLD